MSDSTVRLLRLRDILARISVGKTAIWNWVREGRFPQPVRLGPRCTVWSSTEIDAWITAQVGTEEARFLYPADDKKTPLAKWILPEKKIVATAYSMGMISGIYFLIQGNEIVYVGQSTNLLARLGTHLVEKADKFDRFSWVACPSTLLDIVESMYIYELKPRLNGRQNDGKMQAQLRSEGVEKQIQIRSEELEKHCQMLTKVGRFTAA